MSNGWTPERRARQAALIRTWRPWEKSTGPRTAEGKAQAATNAQAFHGWTPERAVLRAVIRDQKALMRELMQLKGAAEAQLARLLAGNQ